VQKNGETDLSVSARMDDLDRLRERYLSELNEIIETPPWIALGKLQAGRPYGTGD
jgi:hypothetical protein